MRQDTQYKNNMKQTYNVTLSHRQLEDIGHLSSALRIQ